MITTTNYSLKKPETTDNADLTVFVGQNMDTLDTTLVNKLDKTQSGVHGSYTLQFNATTNTLDFVYTGV